MKNPRLHPGGRGPKKIASEWQALSEHITGCRKCRWQLMHPDSNPESSVATVLCEEGKRLHLEAQATDETALLLAENGMMTG